MSSGNFKTKSSGSRMRGSWKLTEIKLAKKKKNELRHQVTQERSREKES